MMKIVKKKKKCCGVAADIEESDLFRGDAWHSFTALGLWPFLMKLQRNFVLVTEELWVPCKKWWVGLLMSFD